MFFVFEVHIALDISITRLHRWDVVFYSTYGFPHYGFHNFKSQNNFLHQSLKQRLTLEKRSDATLYGFLYSFCIPFVQPPIAR